MEQVTSRYKSLPAYGWLGLALVCIFWTLNWTLPGPRTHWGFFPLWLGYCLVVDALVYVRRGTSLLYRNRWKYAGLFVLSAPAWWLFELVNWRLQNWYYDGGELFTPLQFWLFATLSFTTVMPAVFGCAELASTFHFVQRLPRGPVIRPIRIITGIFFLAGWIMLVLMLTWPKLFFPFAWLSVYFILEPINVWRKNRSLAEYTQSGNWQPVLALWVGVLITAFFWEMWNFFSFPKWVYHVPWGNGLHIFEMPALGYGGYLPFALELFAMYHLVSGWLGQGRTDYIQLEDK